MASMKSVVNEDDDVRRNCESSDNDSSSTYGQIKTFETLFESPAAANSGLMPDRWETFFAAYWVTILQASMSEIDF